MDVAKWWRNKMKAGDGWGGRRERKEERERGGRDRGLSMLVAILPINTYRFPMVANGLLLISLKQV